MWKAPDCFAKYLEAEYILRTLLLLCSLYSEGWEHGQLKIKSSSLAMLLGF